MSPRALILMTLGVITFSCPSCHVRLTVPESMAGVSGPCPHCSATIAAPSPPDSRKTPPIGPKPIPPPMPTAPRTDDQGEKIDPTAIPPKPRIQPQAPPGRNRARGIAAKKSTRDAALQRRQSPSSRSSRPSRGNHGIARFLLPVFFITAGATIVFVLCYLFLPGGPGDTLRRSTLQPSGSPPRHQPDSPDAPEADLSSTPGSAEASKPGSVIPGPPPLSADGADAIKAEEVLQRFLTSRSLDDRLKLAEPSISAAEARGTILEDDLPEIISLSSQTPSFNARERFTNYPFRVSFQGGEGSLVEYTVLVRKRGNLEPKVLVDPFLDLVGGRLARFAATPVDGTRTFHAVIEAMSRCFEEGVPNRERKFTYKLSGCDVGRTTARAYASLNSSLAEQLGKPDAPIRWGKRVRATVTLHWNTTEDPSQPYIELLEIKGPDWNP